MITLRTYLSMTEASLLWYKDLKSKLVANGFVENSYYRCLFNKIGSMLEIDHNRTLQMITSVGL